MWRESACSILAAKSIFSSSSSFNYKILYLKRSSDLKFMPSTYVFPGGNLAESDCNREWLALYEKNGFHRDSFQNLQLTKNIPKILMNNRENNLPKYLSLRICAIRETFEECGILLCKNPKVNSDTYSKWASFCGGHELIEWQNKVHNDSREFLNLCIHFKICPDVWALNIWNNWMTPPALPMRFDTLFFLVTLHQMPTVHPDKKEIEDLMWTTPDQGVTLSTSNNIILPIPQFYEISRLKKFTDIEILSKFSRERAVCGCETYWPYRLKTEKGLYSILPGDDLYPDEIEKDNSEIPFMKELPHSKSKNRILHRTEYSNNIIVGSCKPKCNHVLPQ